MQVDDFEETDMRLRKRYEGVAEVKCRLEMGVLMRNTASEMHKVVWVDRLFVWPEGRIL